MTGSVKKDASASFFGAFEKVAFISRHSDEALVRATPKKHGGTTGTGHYFLRYHDKESRWSCTCPDWTARRSWLPKKFKKHWDCKHITAHKKDKNSWEAKPKMPKLDKETMEAAKNAVLEQRRKTDSGE